MPGHLYNHLKRIKKNCSVQLFILQFSVFILWFSVFILQVSVFILRFSVFILQVFVFILQFYSFLIPETVDEDTTAHQSFFH